MYVRARISSMRLERPVHIASKDAATTNSFPLPCPGGRGGGGGGGGGEGGGKPLPTLSSRVPSGHCSRGAAAAA